MTASAHRPAGPDLFLLARLCSRSIVQGEPLEEMLARMESGLEAGEVLRAAAADYPKILAALLKSRLRRPRIDPHGISLGGDDEAWIYREEYRALWQRLGALDWARKFRN